jgi:dihydroorotate dehydrogenase
VALRQGSLRYASDTAAEATEAIKETPKKAGRGLRKTVLSTSLALTLLLGYLYGTDTRASVHRYGVVPLIRLVLPDAEDAHHMGVDVMKTLYKYGLHPRERGNQDGDGVLATEVMAVPR